VAYLVNIANSTRNKPQGIVVQALSVGKNAAFVVFYSLLRRSLKLLGGKKVCITVVKRNTRGDSVRDSLR